MKCPVSTVTFMQLFMSFGKRLRITFFNISLKFLEIIFTYALLMCPAVLDNRATVYKSFQIAFNRVTHQKQMSKGAEL